MEKVRILREKLTILLTKPPLLERAQKLPTRILPAMVCLKTSTPRTSAIISSVS